MALKRVLVIHNRYQQAGGEECVVRQEIALLRRFGVEVVTYFRSNDELQQRGWNTLTMAARASWAGDSCRAVARLIDNHQPDIVHVHNTAFMISPSVYSACRNARVPVVQTLHNFRLLCPAATFFREGAVCEACAQGTLWHSISRACYRNSRPATAAVAAMLKIHRLRRTWSEMIDCYIALTDFARNKFVDYGFAPERIAVKGNFVDPDPGERTAVGDYALFVGRLSEEKGLTTLVRAWANLPAGTALLIAGAGPMHDELCAIAPKNVRLLGAVSKTEVIRLLKGARFLVLPSECYENFPMVIAEAYACGVPVLASDRGAMRELVEHGRTGLLFDSADEQALAHGATAMSSDLNLSVQMGKEARKAYLARYTPDRNYPVLMSIYARARQIQSAELRPRVAADVELLKAR